MHNVRRALIVLLLLAAAAFAWLWLTRPEKVDMAAYVPADSIVYLEADSLPEIFDGVTSTDAWRELSGAAGVELYDAKKVVRLEAELVEQLRT